VDLGLAGATFWRLTPRELQALTHRHRNRLLEDDLRFGQLAVLFAEQLRDRKARPTPFSPADFFPRLRVLVQGAPSPQAAPPGGRAPIDPRTIDPEVSRANSMRMLAKAVDINRTLRGHDLRPTATLDPEPEG
jgi:Phage tail assembly chaperone protein, TAC